MVKLELQDDEAATLREVLESYVSDLRMEIADTDLQDLRNELKAKEVFLKETIVRLG